MSTRVDFKMANFRRILRKIVRQRLHYPSRVPNIVLVGLSLWFCFLILDVTILETKVTSGDAEVSAIKISTQGNGNGISSYQHDDIAGLANTRETSGDPAINGENFGYWNLSSNLKTKSWSSDKYPGVRAYTLYSVTRLKMEPLTNVNPMKPGFGLVINGVTSFRYPLNIDGCDWQQMYAPRSLFIAIFSSPGSFEQRNLTRSTWVRRLRHHSDLIGKARYAFFIGLSAQSKSNQERLNEESDLYDDIIQVDTIDSYANATLKFAGMLRWINRFCPSIDFVLKVDDDVYVNMRNLATTLQSLDPETAGMYGTLNPMRDVVRSGGADTSFMDNETWPWITYPLYLHGESMLVAGKAVDLLLTGFQTTPFIPREDVYSSGLAARRVGLQVYSNEGMFDFQPEFPLDSCMARDTISWMTRSPNEMKFSHVSTVQFYDDVRLCFYKPVNEDDTEPFEVAQPKTVVDFPFSLVAPD